MNRGELIGWVKNRAVEYRDQSVDSIKRNSHMNDLGGECRLTQTEVDALLTDFVNFCGVHQGIDYGMHATNLADESSKAST